MDYFFLGLFGIETPQLSTHFKINMSKANGVVTQNILYDIGYLGRYVL